MEGICRLGGATCTWAAADCPATALGATGSNRDPAGTTGSQSVLSSRGSGRHALSAGPCRHFEQPVGMQLYLLDEN